MRHLEPTKKHQSSITSYCLYFLAVDYSPNQTDQKSAWGNGGGESGGKVQLLVTVIRQFLSGKAVLY